MRPRPGLVYCGQTPGAGIATEEPDSTPAATKTGDETAMGSEPPARSGPRSIRHRDATVANRRGSLRTDVPIAHGFTSAAEANIGADRQHLSCTLTGVTACYTHGGGRLRHCGHWSAVLGSVDSYLRTEGERCMADD